MFLSWNAATTGFLSALALSNSRVVMGIRKCHHSAPSHRVARRKWVKPQFRAKYPFKVCQRLFWSGNSRPAAGVEQRRWAKVFCWFLLWIRRQTRGPLAPPAALLYSGGRGERENGKWNGEWKVKNGCTCLQSQRELLATQFRRWRLSPASLDIVTGGHCCVVTKVSSKERRLPNLLRCN